MRKGKLIVNIIQCKWTNLSKSIQNVLSRNSLSTVYLPFHCKMLLENLCKFDCEIDFMLQEQF